MTLPSKSGGQDPGATGIPMQGAPGIDAPARGAASVGPVVAAVFVTLFVGITVLVTTDALFWALLSQLGASLKTIIWVEAAVAVLFIVPAIKIFLKVLRVERTLSMSPPQDG